MPSTPQSSTESPISKLPYDILREIFTDCLPRYPLLYRQPDARIAPILLCHICSSWRTAALSSATLWTHLSYSLTIYVKDGTDMVAASWAVPRYAKRDLEFIQWWRTHHGPISPFLNLRLNVLRLRGEVMERLTGDTEALLLDYIASAQYLDLDVFYWNRIYGNVPAGYQLPKLRTLIAAKAWGGSYRFHRVLQHHALPALHHLSVEDRELPDTLNFPEYWSTLTHITLQVSTSIDNWFSFIRAVPSLEWGHFDIESLTSADYTAPPRSSLPQLATLRVAVQGNIARHLVSPLNILFADLHLPALHTLSLSTTRARSRTDQHALVELHGVLRAAPALTTLVLEDVYRTLYTYNPTATPKDVPPIWTPAPQLTRVQLALPLIPKADLEAVLDLFVHSVVSPGTAWLDLPNPACPIRSVAICGYEILDHVRDFILVCIQKYAERVPNVVFHITSDDARRVAEDVRNGWGSRI
ncbi:hypothetical protein BJ912DRAFT_995497 [Pholiota molesta]|nr:hypothetical protein BJ912DRAFT_995497 [Pholiota molesta]